MNEIGKAPPPSNNVSAGDLYAALEQLDRQWLAECSRYSMRLKRGWSYFPRFAEAVVGGVIVCGAFSGLTIMIVLSLFSSMGDQVFGVDRFVICAVGVAINLLLALGSLKSILKAAAYQKALAAYEKERHRLTTELGLDRNHGRLDYAHFDRRFGAH
jgi:hypothetical protein